MLSKHAISVHLSVRLFGEDMLAFKNIYLARRSVQKAVTHPRNGDPTEKASDPSLGDSRSHRKLSDCCHACVGFRL